MEVVQAPKLKGYKFISQIGDAECGRVYIAREKGGRMVAVRVLESLAVNRSMLEKLMHRLDGESFPTGMIEQKWISVGERSYGLVMPLMADEVDGEWQPRTLERKFKGLDDEGKWKVIFQLAEALAAMHRKRVAHGQLKPSNVFFDEKGAIWLADYGMGQMPSVNLLQFTDAYLYAPPEQLMNPDGYTEGKGYRWDVYAFGILAYRMLRGQFPRHDEIFGAAAPFDPDARALVEVDADVEEICKLVTEAEVENWPASSPSKKHQALRELILSCLSIDPDKRPADLEAVVKTWHDIERAEKAAVAGKLQKVRFTVVAVAAVASVVLAVTMMNRKKEIGNQLESKKTEFSGQLHDREAVIERQSSRIDELEKQLAKAKNAKLTAEEKFEQQKLRADYAYQQVLASSDMNDRLTGWMMRQANYELPELFENTPRLEILQDQLEAAHESVKENPALQPMKARIELQLAEVYIAQQKYRMAVTTLAQAETTWTEQQMEVPLARSARVHLLALMQAIDADDEENVQIYLPVVRQLVDQIDESHELYARARVALDIQEARAIAEDKPEESLEQLLKIIGSLERLHKVIPQSVRVKSKLAEYALEGASLADALSREDDAVHLRKQASGQLLELLEKNPQLEIAKAQLASIELMAAEAYLEDAEDKKGRDKLAAAEKLLAGLKSSYEVDLQKATALGIKAVVYRDRGDRTQAVKFLKEAVALLEKYKKADSPANDELSYRLAMFHWMLASHETDKKTEFELASKAASLMDGIIEAGAGPREVELRRSLAYLYGDLGKIARELGNNEQAKQIYLKSAGQWQALINRGEPHNEYIEGRQWAKSRADQIK